ASTLDDTLLAGIDLPDQSLFQDWLTAERTNAIRLRGLALRRLATHPDLPPDRALAVVRNWHELEPFSPDAASLLVARLEQFDRNSEAADARESLAARFRKAGITWLKEPQAETQSQL